MPLGASAEDPQETLVKGCTFRSTLHCAYVLLLGATLWGCASTPGFVADDVEALSEVTADGPAADRRRSHRRKGKRSGERQVYGCA